MRKRLVRAGLVALLGLALSWGVAGQAMAAPTWSFELTPAGPLTPDPAAIIDFDMKISALTDAAVSFSPLDFPDSGFTTNLEGDVDLLVESFFDVTFELQDSYTVAGNSMATFPYGTLTILNNAPGGKQIMVIAKAVPDPLDPPDTPHDPFELEVKVPLTIRREPAGVPLPATLLLLGVGLAGAVAWRRTRRD